jgi:hypothetical protein
MLTSIVPGMDPGISLGAPDQRRWDHYLLIQSYPQFRQQHRLGMTDEGG